MISRNMWKMYKNASKQNNRKQMYFKHKNSISKLVTKKIQEINEFCSQGSKVTNKERIRENCNQNGVSF